MNTTTQFQKDKPFPGPKGYPIVGVLPKIRGNLIEFMTGMMRHFWWLNMRQLPNMDAR